MLIFLKELYNGKLPFKDTLWKYSVLPFLLLYFISQLEIFYPSMNKKIMFIITYILIIFSYISWTGLDKIITDPLFLMVIKIIRFVLLLGVLGGPLAMMFIFSGYQGANV